jgi:hypothetical protein
MEFGIGIGYLQYRLFGCLRIRIGNLLQYRLILGLPPHPFPQFGPHPLNFPPPHLSSPSCCPAYLVFLVSLARRHRPAPPRFPSGHAPSEFHNGHPVLVLLYLAGVVEPCAPASLSPPPSISLSRWCGGAPPWKSSRRGGLMGLGVAQMRDWGGEEVVDDGDLGSVEAYPANLACI